MFIGSLIFLILLVGAFWVLLFLFGIVGAWAQMSAVSMMKEKISKKK
jgi:hypothetical protein